MAKSSVLQLLNQHLNQMIQHAQKEMEYEVCGLLGGQWKPYDQLAIGMVVEDVSNIARDRRTQYRMDEREQVRVMSTFGNEGMELVGIYHSHPHGPAYPSPTDIAEATYPDAIYIILSPSTRQAGENNDRHTQVIEDGYEISAWRIQRGRAMVVKIVVIGEK